LKPEQHPSVDADVIVFLDANMPNVKDCKSGCSEDLDRMCVHRFGPSIWLCERPAAVDRPGAPCTAQKVPFGRLRDLEVVHWCIATVRRRWANERGIVLPKHFVLATHDKRFLEDVKIQYGRGRMPVGPPLRFSKGWLPTNHGKCCWIQSGHGKRAVRLEIFMIDGGFRDRNHDLRLVLCCTKELQRSALTPVE
jgi:hypothetical protein